MTILIGDIVAGVFPVDSLLPGEAELVRQFGTSRGVVRECVRGLEERGLVAVKHGMGATVQPKEYWDVFAAEVFQALVELPKDDGLLAEYVESRRVIEVETAGLAAARASAAHRKQLRAAFDHLTEMAHRAAENSRAEDLYHGADIAFHQAVASASRNRALARMAHELHRSITARRVLARPQLRLTRAIPEHQRILDAILARDPEAARAAMKAHLRSVGAYLKEHQK